MKAEYKYIIAKEIVRKFLRKNFIGKNYLEVYKYGGFCDNGFRYYIPTNKENHLDLLGQLDSQLREVDFRIDYSEPTESHLKGMITIKVVSDEFKRSSCIGNSLPMNQFISHAVVSAAIDKLKIKDFNMFVKKKPSIRYCKPESFNSLEQVVSPIINPLGYMIRQDKNNTNVVHILKI